ncbi:MFS transporter [Subtercola sp. YIM 133946]|uniref:MFS transporter n=1 Tax=Subtercola sp. YIM 133946 TaxID=3118909 RepID=UPI002F946DF2
MAAARIRLVGSYADILRVPGSRSFVAAGWLGRMLRSTTGIATILLVSAQSGSFALAGAVSGATVVGLAIGGPLWSRAVDARGQRRVLPLTLTAAAAAAAALVLVVVCAAPVFTWFIAAFLLGAASIDVGSLVRARWRSAVSSPQQRHTSLALESVSDELVFVVGPPLVTLIAASAGTVVGFATGVLVGVGGGFWLWSQRSTTPRVHTQPGGLPLPRRSWRPPAGVLGLLPIYLGVGTVFAAIDLAAVGLGTETGQPWLTGVILAVFSVGSVLAGFAFGPISAGWTPATRVLVSAVAYAVVVPSLLMFQSPGVLASLIFVAGLVTTPVLISGTSLITSRVDESRLTEALTWPSIGLALGVTFGGALAGIVVDDGSAFSAYLISTVAAVAVGVYGVLSSLVNRRHGHPEPVAAVTAGSDATAGQNP